MKYSSNYIKLKLRSIYVENDPSSQRSMFVEFAANIAANIFCNEYHQFINNFIPQNNAGCIFRSLAKFPDKNYLPSPLLFNSDNNNTWFNSLCTCENINYIRDGILACLRKFDIPSPQAQIISPNNNMYTPAYIITQNYASDYSVDVCNNYPQLCINAIEISVKISNSSAFSENNSYLQS